LVPGWGAPAGRDESDEEALRAAAGDTSL